MSIVRNFTVYRQNGQSVKNTPRPFDLLFSFLHVFAIGLWILFPVGLRLRQFHFQNCFKVNKRRNKTVTNKQEHFSAQKDIFCSILSHHNQIDFVYDHIQILRILRCPVLENTKDSMAVVTEDQFQLLAAIILVQIFFFTMLSNSS